jgi:hypothetical protein
LQHPRATGSKNHSQAAGLLFSSEVRYHRWIGVLSNMIEWKDNTHNMPTQFKPASNCLDSLCQQLVTSSVQFYLSIRNPESSGIKPNLTELYKSFMDMLQHVTDTIWSSAPSLPIKTVVQPSHLKHQAPSHYEWDDDDSDMFGKVRQISAHATDSSTGVTSKSNLHGPTHHILHRRNWLWALQPPPNPAGPA